MGGVHADVRKINGRCCRSILFKLSHLMNEYEQPLASSKKSRLSELLNIERALIVGVRGAWYLLSEILLYLCSLNLHCQGSTEKPD